MFFNQIRDVLFEEFLAYLESEKIDLREILDSLEKPSSFPDLDYYNQVSAVYSSKIEGNSLDLNSFLNPGAGAKPKEKAEILDLVAGYNFAQRTNLSEDNFLQTHYLLSKEFLIEEKRGKYRFEPVGVFSERGLVYTAVEFGNLEKVMSQFFGEIKEAFSENLSLEESFFYASLIHLRVAHIHPFSDGNGRVVRLLEKWFLSQNQQIGEKAWWIFSEKYYFENRGEYYQNLNLGSDFYTLDYSKSLNFLKMLVESLNSTVNS